MDRFRFERHVEAAALPGPSVAILMMLARRVNRAQGAIPDTDQPSLAVLARATGYDKATVVRHLHLLEAAGWIHRAVPPRWAQQQLHMNTSYTLLVPRDYPRASRTVHLERIARAEMAERSALAGVAGPGDTADGPSAPGAVAPEPGAGSRDPHRSQGSSKTQESKYKSSSGADDELAELARNELKQLTGRAITAEQAAEAVRLVLEGREVASPAAYLRRALRADPARFLPAPSSPPSLAEVEAELRRKTQEDT